MSSEKQIINTCKDLRVNLSLFRKFNRPARIIAFLAIVIPLGILIPTSPLDENEELDLTQSEYSTHAGIIFVVGAGLAYYFSKKASPFKIIDNQEWAINAYNAYENLTEYQRESTLENYKENALAQLTQLIREIKKKINDADDKIQWMIPFANPIGEILLRLEHNVLPIVRTGTKEEIPSIKSYLTKLMTYILHPSESLLNELLSIEIKQPIEGISKPISEIVAEKQINLKQVLIFGIFVIVGIFVYFLARFIEVDNNTAFLGSITLTAALIGGYFVYMKK